jgi:hypothetical protein
MVLSKPLIQKANEEAQKAAEEAKSFKRQSVSSFLIIIIDRPNFIIGELPGKNPGNDESKSCRERAPCYR